MQSAMKVFYARVSTKDQDLAVQIAKANEVGVDKVFAEKQSGLDQDRPELNSHCPSLLAYWCFGLYCITHALKSLLWIRIFRRWQRVFYEDQSPGY